LLHSWHPPLCHPLGCWKVRFCRHWSERGTALLSSL
jgi:hypothetical protein